MHIMHIIDSLAPGGAERMLVDIANHTDSGAHKVSVCVTRSDTTLAGQLREDIHLYVLERKSRFDFRGMMKFAELVKSNSVSLLHIHGRTSFSFAALAKQMKLVSVPLILHDHFGGIELDRSIPLWFKIWGMRKVSYYVGVYEKLGEWAKSVGIPEEKIGVIGNALDLNRINEASPLNLQASFNIPADVAVGIWIGGIRKEKGLDVLIDALNLLVTRGLSKKLKILIVGGSADEAYFRMCCMKIDALNLRDYFVFLGKRADTPRIIRGADFAVISSISESGPLVLIEYLAAGLPVVGTRVGSISREVEGKGFEGFVNPGDPCELFKGFLDFCTLSPDKLALRRAKGENIAFEHFSIEKKMPQWYWVYEHVFKTS